MTAWFLEAVHANPWGADFVDLPTLNASASDAIETAVRNVREVARTRPAALRSACLTVLGPAGAGKTHLFGRLRARLGPRAVFVHIRPLVGTEMTPRFVLHEIVRQLGFVSGDVRQVDALVGSLLAHAMGSSAGFPRFFVEDTAHLDPTARAERLEQMLSQLLDRWQELDESYLRRLLAVPFQKSPTDRAVLAWLSGRELDAVQLERAGATAALGEEIVVPALKSLASSVSGCAHRRGLRSAGESHRSRPRKLPPLRVCPADHRSRRHRSWPGDRPDGPRYRMGSKHRTVVQPRTTFSARDAPPSARIADSQGKRGPAQVEGGTH